MSYLINPHRFAVPSGGGSCITSVHYDVALDSTYNTTDGVDKISFGHAVATLVEDTSASPTEYVWGFKPNFTTQIWSGGSYTTTQNFVPSGTTVYLEVVDAGSSVTTSTVGCNVYEVGDATGTYGAGVSSVAHQLNGTSGGAANTSDEIEIKRHTGQLSGNVLKFPYRMRVDCGGVTTRSDWAWMSFDVAAMASSASLSVYDGSCATNYNVTRCVGGAAYVVSDTGNNYPTNGDVVMYQDGGGTYRCATVGTESLYAANDGDIDMTGFSNCSDCQMYSGE